MISDRIAITGLGMITALGGNAAIACAAARAGIHRITELPFMIFDPKAGEIVPAVGHPADLCTRGFSGISRLCRLSAAAIQDLIQNSGADAALLSDTPLYLNVCERFLSDASCQRLNPEGQMPEAIERHELNTFLEDDIRQRMVPLISDIVGVTFRGNPRFSFDGHAGVFQLIRQALDDMRSGLIQRCIVGGIDSCVETDKLQGYYDLELLAGPENSVGFFPGEAAAFMLMERLSSAKQRGATAHGILGAVGLADEPNHRFSGFLTKGEALAAAIQAVIHSSAAGGKSIRLILSDLNGDQWRAHEWGNALVRLNPDYGIRSVRVRFPAESFGEVGAAAGATAICMAGHAFTRRYARSQGILLTASSYDGRKAAMALFDPAEFPI